jgi:glycosyl transferase, family 25
MRVYVINLDKDGGRLARMQREFAKVGLAYQRVPGILGADLPADLAPYFTTDTGKLTPTLTAGEIGCYAAHMRAWKLIAAGEAPHALVFEDDVSLDPDFVRVAERAAAWAPPGWDLIRLSSPTKRPVHRICPLTSKHALVHYLKSPVLAGAYLLSREGARKLLKPELRVRPNDLDFARPWLWDLDAYGVLPAPAIQDDFTKLPGQSSIDAVEKRHLARRAHGFSGMPSRIFGRDRLQRLRYNVRTIGFRTTARIMLAAKLGKWRPAVSAPSLSITRAP